MKYFAELTNKEKAEVTDLGPYVRLECAERGINVPPPPVEQELLPLPVVHYRKMTAVNVHGGENIVFDNPTDAEIFLNMPTHYCYAYSYGGTADPAAIQPSQSRLLSISVCSASEKEAFDNISSKNEKIQKANKALCEEYNNQLSELTAIEDSLRDMVYSCQQKIRGFEAIRAKYLELSELTEHNDAVTARFLLKVFTHDKIVEVLHWFGNTACSWGHVIEATEDTDAPALVCETPSYAVFREGQAREL